MSEEDFPKRKDKPLVLDSCCLINIGATGLVKDILAARNADAYVARYVLEMEALHVRSGIQKGAPGTEVLDFSSDVHAKRLIIVDPSDSELLLALRFASSGLDDGEAISAAVAISRGWLLATDDRKAISLVRSERKDLRVVTTAEILRDWTDVEGIDGRLIAKVLRRIEERACFTPPAKDPFFEWWAQAKKGYADGLRKNQLA